MDGAYPSTLCAIDPYLAPIAGLAGQGGVEGFVHSNPHNTTNTPMRVSVTPRAITSPTKLPVPTPSRHAPTRRHPTPICIVLLFIRFHKAPAGTL